MTSKTKKSPKIPTPLEELVWTAVAKACQDGYARGIAILLDAAMRALAPWGGVGKAAEARVEYIVRLWIAQERIVKAGGKYRLGKIGEGTNEGMQAPSPNTPAEEALGGEVERTR